MTDEGYAKPWVEFQNACGERWLSYPPLSNMQKLFERFAAVAMSKFTFPTPDPTVKTEDAVTDKGTKVRIYTPDGYKGGKPVCLYYHGGGWAMGNIDGDDPISRAISKSGDIVVVSVEYGLAPDNAHPGLMNECFHALQWALQNAKRLNTAEDKFLTSGFSAGGQIAFGTALMAVDQGLGDLVGVACMVPCTVHPDGVPDELKAKYTTMDKFAHMTINTAPAMRGFWELFGAPPTDPYGSPLLHPRIKDLKRVYMAIAGLDTLRDDGLLMKEKLDQAGVPNKVDVYDGYPHDFMLWPAPQLEQIQQQGFINLEKGLKFVLG